MAKIERLTFKNQADRSKPRSIPKLQDLFAVSLGALVNKAASSSNGDITFDSSTENASIMAEKALESTINIAPTGYTQIRQRINIIVARDIDMSSVYRFD